MRVCSELRLAGVHREMTFASHDPSVLWQMLMPERKKLISLSDPNLYSVEIYPDGFFRDFSPMRPFQKWAAIQKPETSELPDFFNELIVPEGLYAVFTYKGSAKNAAAFYREIFEIWLPDSGYLPDDRPHLAIMNGHYNRDDETSEEEILIPVKMK